MNLWQKTAIALLRSLIALVFVLNLTSCGSSDKAVSQEPSGKFQETVQISRQVSEVSPPATIQELQQVLEDYQPQVTIVDPQLDEVLQDNTVEVRFEVKDLPIFKDSEWDLGPHLHLILDNEPYRAVYDLDKPLVLSDLSPGTHTLRVFASRPWHESFKNEGAYAQSTFHIFTKTDDNNPDPNLPLLTYSRPKGSYGAEPILLDFYLTNAPLHLVAKDNPNDEITDWRIRCTVNGESFVLDRWQAVYLKGFKPGKNWVKLEFLDEQGNPIKNVFNSTVRMITYEPKGNDTLSKIVRGEISADQVRKIVDPNYTESVPVTEPTPSQTLKPTVETPETQPQVPETEPTPIPTSIPTVKEKTPETQTDEEKSAPKAESQQAPEIQPEKAKRGGFFNRFRHQKDKTPDPETTAEPIESVPSIVVPEIIESPQPETTVEPQLEETPKAESTTVPEKDARDLQTPTVEPSTVPEASPQPKQRWGLGGYFNRRASKTLPQVTAEPTPSLPPTLPEIVIDRTSEPVAPQLEQTLTEKTLPEKVAPESDKPELQRYFSPLQYPDSPSTPTLPQTPPDVIKPPSVLKTLENPTTLEQQSEDDRDDS